jgi:hypothetical protein
LLLKTSISITDRKNTTRESGSVVLLFLFLLTSVILILISCIQMGIQASYATTAFPEVRKFGIKVGLDKNIVAQGGTQAIRFQVDDEESHQSIAGAITRATVKYPDGKTVRQFSAPTDMSGRSSISLRIEPNAPLGSYEVLYSVFETGYTSESNFGDSFGVVEHGMALNKSINSNYYNGSSSVSLTGSSTQIVRSVHIN